MKGDERCQLCGFEGESINHVLFSCHFARQCWALSDLPSPPNGFNVVSIYENISYLLNLSKNQKVEVGLSRVWPWLLWYMWKNMNGFLFEGKRFDAREVVRKAKDEALLVSGAASSDSDGVN